MTLTKQILMLFETLDASREVSFVKPEETTNEEISWMKVLVEDTKRRLKLRCDELKNGIITEPFTLNFWNEYHHHQSLREAALEKNPKIREIFQELYQLLDEIEDVINEMDPEAYGRYYMTMKTICDETNVKAAYKLKKLSVGRITAKKLKTIQVEAVLKAIKTGIMNHDYSPSNDEMQQVDVERVWKEVNDKYVQTEEFKGSAARFRRYIMWKLDIMKFNYNEYGRYICRTWDQFSVEQLLAIFELDMMLRLIHQDMAKLTPDLAKYLNDDERYFPIVKNLSVLLQRKWFEAMRTHTKYNKEWIDGFLQNLMTECGDMIEEEWQVADRREKVKCWIIGILKDAGVLKGSYQAIAEKVELDSENLVTSLANYMGEGKKQPYFDWICNYVNR